jgi:hypothetical protein
MLSLSFIDIFVLSVFVLSIGAILLFVILFSGVFISAGAVGSKLAFNQSGIFSSLVFSVVTLFVSVVSNAKGSFIVSSIISFFLISVFSHQFIKSDSCFFNFVISKMNSSNDFVISLLTNLK